MMPDLLETIVASTRHSVEARESRRPLPLLVAELDGRRAVGTAFHDALTRTDRLNVIAECKRRSPSRGILRDDYDPAAIARSYEEAGAAAISVLTEPTFFDGALDHLRAVRAATTLPVLRKDFIVAEYQLVEAVEAGASAALLIAAALEGETLAALIRASDRLGLAALVEVHDRAELARALAAGARIVGVNNRNLRTLEVDLSASNDLIGLVPSGIVAVAESGLRRPEDLHRLRAAGFSAFLIGESLMSAVDPGLALREMLRPGDGR
jgi:indole-3-glycerol phosphate synthase